VPVATFITRVPGSGSGIRLWVKDLIDVAGVPATAGSRAVAAAAAAEWGRAVPGLRRSVTVKAAEASHGPSLSSPAS
jgi:hypothetical protein